MNYVIYIYIGTSNCLHKIKDSVDESVELLTDDELRTAIYSICPIDGLLVDNLGNIITEFGQTVVRRVEKMNRARRLRRDEFYTRYRDIDAELSQYPLDTYRNKVIYLPADVAVDEAVAPKSNFVKWFVDNVEKLQFKRLVATSLASTAAQAELGVDVCWNCYILEQVGKKYVESFSHCLADDKHESGDFRSDFCKELFEQADLIVTNPPFSIAREFMHSVFESGAEYILILNKTTAFTKECFEYLKSGKLFFGYWSMSGHKFFYAPAEYAVSLRKEVDGEICVSQPTACVVSSSSAQYQRHYTGRTLQELESDGLVFEKYLNYDAINVDRSCNIPVDYDGLIGVPVSFVDWYNPDECEIVDCICGELLDELGEIHRTFKRLIIRWRKEFLEKNKK